MLDLTTHADVRDLDRLYLATIGGADYYELRQVVRESDGRRVVVGLASAWPVISRDAQIAELTALAAASAQQAAEADVHCAELIARQSAYEEEIATLRAARDRLTAELAALHAAPIGWACVDCGATVGRSIGDPTRCKQCLRTSMPVVVAPGDIAKLNGHLPDEVAV